MLVASLIFNGIKKIPIKILNILLRLKTCRFFHLSDNTKGHTKNGSRNSCQTYRKDCKNKVYRLI